ncbi:MAG: hypothetical protein OXH68_20980 [Gammaproteobacteria bacterium]|nr:hypothetical protein [Gammaproteobacteria bacterium]
MKQHMQRYAVSAAALLGFVAVAAMATMASSGDSPGDSATTASPGGWAPPVVPLTKFDGHGPRIDDFGEDRHDAVLWTSGASSNLDRDEALPVPTLYEHSGLQDDLGFIMSQAPIQQRVAVRAGVQRGFPVIYAPYHWLPDKTMRIAMLEAAESGTSRDLRDFWVQSGASPLGEDHALWDAINLFGLLNVRIFHEPGDKECCAPYAELVMDIGINEFDARRVRAELGEISPGIYYLDDPISVARDVLAEVISMGNVPLMTIAAVEGVGVAPSVEPIAYVVRWGDLELEYGTHYAGDPLGVVR